MNILKKWLRIIVTFVMCVIGALVTCFSFNYSPDFMVGLDNKLHDWFFYAQKYEKGDSRIVVIDIDDESVKRVGQWPWDRETIARVIEGLSEAKTVGLDIVFSEKDRINEFAKAHNIDVVDYDKYLAEIIGEQKVVVGFVLDFNNKPDGKKDIFGDLMVNVINLDKDAAFDLKDAFPYFNAQSVLISIDEINEAAFANGFVNYIQEEDAVVRQAPLVAYYDGEVFASLTLNMFARMLDSDSIDVYIKNGSIAGVGVGEHIIKSGIQGIMTIKYKGHAPNYEYVSAYKLLNGEIDKSYFKGKAVLVGTSAIGLSDLRTSPLDTRFAGVEAHANMLDSMLNNDYLVNKKYETLPNYLCYITMAILFFFAFIDSKISRVAIYISLIFGGFVTFELYSYLKLGVFYDVSYLLFEYLFFVIAGIFINYFFEYRQKEKIKSKFAAKVSNSVVEELMNSDSNMKVSKRNISIFFSDIRDFTTISEKVGDPEKLVNMLNRYMTPMSEIIMEKKGTVDKYIGDAIMAYFNAPNEVKNHADAALCSAIEQIRALRKLNEELTKEGFFDELNKVEGKHISMINIGIGINTGECIVGEMGSESRSDYTCIGDPVNLASRIEGNCKDERANILISEFTLKELEDPSKYELVEIEKGFKAKGKEEEVKLYKCLGYKGEDISLW